MVAAEMLARERAENDRLRRLLALHQGASGLLIEEPPAWARELTPQETQLVGALMKAAPNWVRAPALDRALQHHLDREGRDPRHLIGVHVRRIRQKLGHDAIETLHGSGYRLGPALRSRA